MLEVRAMQQQLAVQRPYIIDRNSLKTALTRSAQLFQEAMQAEAEQNYVLALTKYGGSLELNGEQGKTWSRIGNIFLRLGKWQQALDAFELVRTLEPQNGEAYHGLGMAYQQMGRAEEACTYIDTAKRLRPDNSLTCLLHACIQATTNTDQAQTLDLFRGWGQRFADPLLATAAALKPERRPERPLKVGYLSGDMREHSIAFFMAPIFANHDPAQVDISVYSTGVQKDDMTEHLKSLVPHWYNVASLKDDALLALIRKHKIDILVDLSGHTEGQRLMVFARRAAPVQVTWLGFMSTLGMQAMDYRLTDYAMDPPGNEAYYVEKLFRMDCMASYSPPPYAELAATPPMLSGSTLVNEAPLLVSLNHSRKLTDDMLLLWRRILLQREDCRLLLHVNEHTLEEAVAAIQPRLERLGLPIDRIYISPHVALTEFMTRGHIADIALDTSPISGGTTTLHALWMGLPVIAFEGDAAVSSSTANTLKALGLEHFIAYDEDAYVQKVLALLDDPQALQAHRAGIRQTMQASVLMDYKVRCQELERAYRLMWFNYLLDTSRYLHSSYDAAQETLKVMDELKPTTKKNIKNNKAAR